MRGCTARALFPVANTGSRFAFAFLEDLVGGSFALLMFFLGELDSFSPPRGCVNFRSSRELRTSLPLGRPLTGVADIRLLVKTLLVVQGLFEELEDELDEGAGAAAGLSSVATGLAVPRPPATVVVPDPAPGGTLAVADNLFCCCDCDCGADWEKETDAPREPELL